MPFVTEKISASLPHGTKALCIETYPEIRKINEEHVAEVDRLIDVITGVRQLRVDYEIKPAQNFDITIIGTDGKEIAPETEMSNMLMKLAKVSWVSHLEGDVVVRPISNGSIGFDVGQIVDYEAEKAKLEKEQTRLQKEIARGEGMLSNQNFISKAPEAKISEEREKLETYRRQYEVVQQQLAEVIAKIK